MASLTKFQVTNRLLAHLSELLMFGCSGEMKVAVECLKCGHVGVLTREALTRFSIQRDAPIAAFVKRPRCRRCAIKGAAKREARWARARSQRASGSSR